jgi:hypothetical protein
MAGSWSGHLVWPDPMNSQTDFIKARYSQLWDGAVDFVGRGEIGLDPVLAAGDGTAWHRRENYPAKRGERDERDTRDAR